MIAEDGWPQIAPPFAVFEGWEARNMSIVGLLEIATAVFRLRESFRHPLRSK